MKKIDYFKNPIKLFTFLLIVWGIYRFLFPLSETFEELVVKPLIWVGATFYFLKREKQDLTSLGISSRNLFPAIYFALFLGAIFAIEGILVNFFKYKGLSFQVDLGGESIWLAFSLSLVTAFTEEIVFRGYIFSRLLMFFKKELLANLVTSFGWVIIHLPVAIFISKLTSGPLIIYLFLTLVFGFGSAFVFARTKNLASSILLHVFWGWSLILFR